MKNYEEIMKEMESNRNQIESNKNEIKKLNMDEEKNALLHTNGFKFFKSEEYKKLTTEAEKNAGKIENLLKENQILQYENRVLLDNRKYVDIEEAKPIIIEAFKKYAGKPYGEKTKNKIYDEIKNNGFSVYLKGDHILGITRLNANGYTTGSSEEIYHYKEKFLTPENKINIEAFKEIGNPHKYTEEPRKAAKKIIEKAEELKKAIETARKIAEELNEIKPETINGIHLNEYDYRIF